MKPAVTENEEVTTKGTKNYFSEFVKENATLLCLVALGILITILEPAFFTPRNLTNLTKQVTVIGIMTIGMTMVILLAGIDLSVGSIVGLSAVTVCLLMQAGISAWLSIIITIFVCGVLIGIWNGFWIAKYKIPAFIITLGMMTIARGLAMVITAGSSVPVTNSGFAIIGNGYISKSLTLVLLGIALVAGIYGVFKGNTKKREYGIKVDKVKTVINIVMISIGILFAAAIFGSYKGIPIQVAIFVAIILIGVYVLRNTKFGRSLYAMGGNEEAARLSGINVFKNELTVYAILTTLASISGIILASRLNGASPNLGNMFELDTIASVAIGGTSFTGGYGTITGSIIGAFIIGVLNNGMSLLGINTFYQFIAKGFIIIFAVWYDTMSRKKKI